MDDYRDILDRPRPLSKHTPMSRQARAAQFAPFAALTGYEAAIKEEARLTDSRIERSDEQNDTLNRTLAALADSISDTPAITVTYFVADDKKDGGSYATVCGNLRRIDSLSAQLIFTDKRTVPLADILEITRE